MAEREVIGRVHGKHSTYVVLKRSTVFSTEYYVRREPSGQVSGAFSSRAAAFAAAHEKAGSGAYETS